MDGDALPLAAQLQAWRAQGADRVDPARFDILQALAARASTQQGEARRLLDARLAGLMRAYAERLAQRPTVAPSMPVRDTGLRALVDALQARSEGEPLPDAAPLAPSALTQARDVWAQVRTDRQLRASLHEVPADAGPLNSGMLVHRALHLMRAASPGYLQHFIAYADALSLLEQLQHAVAPLTSATDAPRPLRRAPRKKKPAAT